MNPFNRPIPDICIHRSRRCIMLAVRGYSACLPIDREGKVVSVYKDSLAPPAEIEELLEKKDSRRH